MPKGLTGTLSIMALPDLLQWVAAGRKTGTLRLQGEAFQVSLMFNGGAIVGSSSNDPREYLGQFLLSEGLITEHQLKDAFDLQARTRADELDKQQAGVPLDAPSLAILSNY